MQVVQYEYIFVQHSKLIFSFPSVNWVFGRVFWQRFPSAVPRKTKGFREILKTSAEERGSQY